MTPIFAETKWNGERADRQTVGYMLCAYTPNNESENLLRHRITSKLNREDN